MSSKSFVGLCSWIAVIVVIVVIVGIIVGGFLVMNRGIENANIESEFLSSQKTMELLDTYDIVTPSRFGELSIHSTMYVVHDSDRNVTCYLYDDGISCIPDRFLEEVWKWE